jgi:hypothetical protein
MTVRRDGIPGKTLKSHEQNVNTEEKLALVLCRDCLILVGKTSASVRYDELT